MEWLEFLLHHWFLCSLFILILLWVVYIERSAQLGGLDWCSPNQLVKMMSQAHAKIYDVRPIAQFKAGHILGAQSLPELELASQLKKISRHKAKPVVLVCQTGSQSTKVGAVLKKEGFEKIHALKGGMQQWQSESLPLIKEEEAK